MNAELKIPVGGMYQKWDCLIDLLKDNMAKKLEALAVSNGWRKIEPNEAYDMGFTELVNWSIPASDVLVLIDDNYLVCIPKNMYCAAEC